MLSYEFYKMSKNTSGGCLKIKISSDLPENMETNQFEGAKYKFDWF